jgi:probable phosphoglycerate mutase
MTEIILIRHGQTAWNANEIFRGRIDIELDDNGKEQAAKLGEYLSQRHIKAVYSSPLRRAVQTAGAITRHHQIDIHMAPGLIDIDFGEWQGLSLDTVRQSYPALFPKWVDEPHRMTIPGGDSLDNVRLRSMQVVEKAIAVHEGTVVLVSHRVVLKVLVCTLLGLGNSYFWSFRLDTCGMTTFFHENGRFVLTELNNTSFLETTGQARLSDF